MIKSLDQWVVMQQITCQFSNFKDFQKYNKQLINNLFTANQVKEAHFKKKQSNSKSIPDISTVRGFNSKNDEPIDVVLIAKY